MPLTYWTFLSGALVLLMAPGPTNTLMGLAGARGGLRSVVRLVPAEVFGYLTVVIPLVLFGSELLAQFPEASLLLKCGAAGWIMFLAVRLWGRRDQNEKCSLELSMSQIYLTTVLNPKALVFGLVLLPSQEKAVMMTKLGLFIFFVGAAGLVWGAVGSLARSVGKQAPQSQLIRRFASCWLAVVSLTLIAGVYIQQ